MEVYSTPLQFVAAVERQLAPHKISVVNFQGAFLCGKKTFSFAVKKERKVVELCIDWMQIQSIDPIAAIDQVSKDVLKCLLEFDIAL